MSDTIQTGMNWTAETVKGYPKTAAETIIGQRKVIASLESQLSQANERIKALEIDLLAAETKDAPYKAMHKADMAKIKALENPWVSVDERLPNDEDYSEDGYVLVLTRDNIVQTDNVDVWSYPGDPDYNGWGLDSFGEKIVTHWMPIPESAND